MNKAGLFAHLKGLTRRVGQAARLMVGLPDYGTYVEHMRSRHPGQCVMSYEEFFHERQHARYGARGRTGRCC